MMLPGRSLGLLAPADVLFNPLPLQCADVVKHDIDDIQKLPVGQDWCYYIENMGEIVMYATMEADIRKGRIVPLEPEKVPKSGRVLLVLLGQTSVASQWKAVRSRLGWLRMHRDPSKWQQQVRDEWR